MLNQSVTLLPGYHCMIPVAPISLMASARNPDSHCTLPIMPAVASLENPALANASASLAAVVSPSSLPMEAVATVSAGLHASVWSVLVVPLFSMDDSPPAMLPTTAPPINRGPNIISKALRMEHTMSAVLVFGFIQQL